MSSTYLKAAGFPLRTAVESTPATTDHAEFVHGRLIVADFVLRGIWSTLFGDPETDLYGALDAPLGDLLALAANDLLDASPERCAGVKRQLQILLFETLKH